MLLGGLCLLAVGHALSFSDAGPIDDDFICMRYGRSFLSGDGLVFNPGQVVEGFTAPLWVMILAVGMAVGLDPVHVSVIVSALACGLIVASVGVAWQTLRPRSAWPVPAILVATSPALAFHGAAGLGTTLLAGLLALWFALGLRAEARGQVPTASALVLALACLLRQEAALFALPFALGPGRSRPDRDRWAPGWIPLAALALWTSLRVAYYGRFLPMTYGVKKLPVGEDLRRGVEYFGVSTIVCGMGVFLLGSFLILCKKRCSDEPLRGSNGMLRSALVGLVLHTLYVIWVGGDYVALARFFVPSLPLAMVLACLGVSLASTRMGGARRFVLWLLTCLAVAFPQALQFRLPFASLLDDHCRPYLGLLHRFDEQRWEALGRHFREVAPPDCRVALSPIGAFGWYSELEIVDILGLTHSAAASRRPDLRVELKGHHRSDGAWVLGQEPDYIILGNGVRDHEGRLVVNPWEASIVQHPDFRERYLHEYLPIPGGADLDLFRRKGSVALPGARSAR